MQRVFAVPRNTLAGWLEEEADSLPELSTTLAQVRSDDILELDELWSFVLRKCNKRWVWLALCRRTRQIVAYVIGDRSESTCRKLWTRIPETYRHCHTFSDLWQAYQKVFADETHSSLGKGSGQTNHIERWNNTLRQRLARFVRKSLSFSKSDYFHELVLKIFIHRFNRLRLISQTRSTTCVPSLCGLKQGKLSNLLCTFRIYVVARMQSDQYRLSRRGCFPPYPNPAGRPYEAQFSQKFLV